jgi:dienelactone hydrolase
MIGELWSKGEDMFQSNHFTPIGLLFISIVFQSCSSSKSPVIEINLREAMIDEAVHVLVINCSDEEQIMLRASMIDDDSVKWVSDNYFTSKDGIIDLTTMSPDSGSYSGADAMGFIWSMKPDPFETVLFSSKRLSPLTISLALYANDSLITSTDISRLRIKEDILRIEVRDNGLVGTFFIPQNASNIPAIIDLTGSGGGMSETRAALLASHGYASLALAYFGSESLPKNLTNIPLEYFKKAIEFLQHQNGVDPEKIAVIGGSRGGELSLLLGATYREIKCVIGYVPSIYRCPGAEGPAWTINDKPLSFISSTGDEQVMADIQQSMASGKATSFLPIFTSIINDPDAIKGTEIPIENIGGDILLISGKDDQLWPSSTMSEKAMERLKSNEFKHNYKHLTYPDAGHMISAPYIPTTISEATHPVNGMFMKLGGTPEGNAYARMDSWRQILQFLEDSFKFD